MNSKNYYSNETNTVEPSAPPESLVCIEELLHLKSLEELNKNLSQLQNIIFHVEELLEISNLTNDSRKTYKQHLQFCKSKANEIKLELNINIEE